MPAEWEPHAATWLAWPHNEEDWPGNFAPIPRVFAEIIAHLSAAVMRTKCRTVWELLCPHVQRFGLPESKRFIGGTLAVGPLGLEANPLL